MLEYIDSHAHYDDAAFDDDRYETIERVHAGGVMRIINIGCTEESSLASLGFAERYEYVYAAVGMHPENVDDVKEGYIDRLKKMCANEKTVAVGEIGLDYHYEGFDREKQQRIFSEQLELAEELGLPVIVHSRDAAMDTLDILKKYRPKGVMHCFSGSPETAEEVLRLGMYLGFTGAVTFRNAKRAAKVLEMVPADRLLLETDCPYMAPEPHRGKRCDSSLIVHTIARIAEIKGMTAEEVASAATENTYRLFERMKQHP